MSLQDENIPDFPCLHSQRKQVMKMELPYFSDMHKLYL